MVVVMYQRQFLMVFSTQLQRLIGEKTQWDIFSTLEMLLPTANSIIPIKINSQMVALATTLLRWSHQGWKQIISDIACLRFPLVQTKCRMSLKSTFKIIKKLKLTPNWNLKSRCLRLLQEKSAQMRLTIWSETKLIIDIKELSCKF